MWKTRCVRLRSFSRIAATDFIASGLASLIFDSTGGWRMSEEYRPRSNIHHNKHFVIGRKEIRQSGGHVLGTQMTDKLALI